MATYRIERLEAAHAEDADLRALAALLVDAVDSGAAVSFLAPLALDKAEAWWREQCAGAHPRSVHLIARDEGGAIIGTVQLQPAWAPNQPHRADVCKMIVHRRARGGGVARRLLRAVECAAWDAGFTLLVLDTKLGCAAEGLYQSSGWTRVGTIPCFAMDPDGVTPHATVVFYKDLRRGQHKELGASDVTLRPVTRGDLDVLYAMHADPEACRMAGTKPRTREAFLAHWGTIFGDPGVIPRVIEVRGNGVAEIAGSVNVFQADGVNMVGYAIARRHWGRGIATRALAMFLAEVRLRPLYAITAADNAASIRVLERCGFACVGREMGEETERYVAGAIARFALE